MEHMFQHSLEAHEEVMEYLRSLPRPPWYRRYWNRSKARVTDMRESLALFIAPWLDRGDDW
jgi:hypothetical protein